MSSLDFAPPSKVAPERVAARREQLCGAPTMLGWKTPDQCPRCRRLVNTVRKCLRCEKSFVPGCKSSFTCRACYAGRQPEWKGYE